jgi:hypothetical protein
LHTDAVSSKARNLCPFAFRLLTPHRSRPSLLRRTLRLASIASASTAEKWVAALQGVLAGHRTGRLRFSDPAQPGDYQQRAPALVNPSTLRRGKVKDSALSPGAESLLLVAIEVA